MEHVKVQMHNHSPPSIHPNKLFLKYIRRPFAAPSGNMRAHTRDQKCRFIVKHHRNLSFATSQDKSALPLIKQKVTPRKENSLSFFKDFTEKRKEITSAESKKIPTSEIKLSVTRRILALRAKRRNLLLEKSFAHSQEHSKGDLFRVTFRYDNQETDACLSQKPYRNNTIETDDKLNTSEKVKCQRSIQFADAVKEYNFSFVQVIGSY